jgi:hypothetical protein
MADAMTDEERAAAEAEAAANGNGSDGEAAGGERQTLEQLAADDPDADDETEQFTLFGSQSKINSKVGGPKVTASATRFTAKRQPIPGQFELGETVRGTWVGRVKDLQFPSKKNSDGSYEVTRVHVVELERISQAEDVPEEFAILDGRGRAAEDGELAKALARVKELEALLEA